METKQITLQELLKKLDSYKPAFKDTTKTKGYRIRCYEPLSKDDLRILKAATKDNEDVTSINNKHEWVTNTTDGELQEPRFVFLLTLTKAPTKIIVRDLKS